QGATAFDQDISGWDVSKVTTMQGMFAEATSFNQDLSDWNLSSISRVSTSFGPVIDAMSSIFYHSRLENEFTEQVLTLLGNMDCARVILTNPNLKNSNYCKIYKSKNWSEFKGSIFVTCSDVCL
ncbi:MAG: BspA family leucine-rich repeat surface protein, partial [Proteobacteria bacterium]|nr:BspA family leucine-rich repeat surface protein [Pseudomonadota bacterium]